MKVGGWYQISYSSFNNKKNTIDNSICVGNDLIVSVFDKINKLVWDKL